MKVLGLDPGTRITGYGIVDEGGGRDFLCIAGGDIKAKASAPLPERLLMIAGALEAVIEEHKPEAVAVETVFYSKNVKSAITLGHIRGVLLLKAAGAGLEVFEYSPTTIKQAVVGYGAATKEQVQKMVKQLLHVEEEFPPDASDALAAAICHINHLGMLRAVKKGSS